MKNFIIKWRELKNEFGLRSVIDALFAGVVYGMLIFVPVYIIFAEITMIFMYQLYTIVILITFSAMLNVFVINKLAAKALKLKKPEATSDIKTVMIYHAGFWMSIVFIIGLVFIFVIIPILWV